MGKLKLGNPSNLIKSYFIANVSCDASQLYHSKPRFLQNALFISLNCINIILFNLLRIHTCRIVRRCMDLHATLWWPWWFTDLVHITLPFKGWLFVQQKFSWRIGWSDKLVASVLGLGPGVHNSSHSSGKNFVFTAPSVSNCSPLHKGSQPMEQISL